MNGRKGRGYGEWRDEAVEGWYRVRVERKGEGSGGSDEKNETGREEGGRQKGGEEGE